MGYDEMINEEMRRRADEASADYARIQAECHELILGLSDKYEHSGYPPKVIYNIIRNVMLRIETITTMARIDDDRAEED